MHSQTTTTQENKRNFKYRLLAVYVLFCAVTPFCYAENGNLASSLQSAQKYLVENGTTFKQWLSRSYKKCYHKIKNLDVASKVGIASGFVMGIRWGWRYKVHIMMLYGVTYIIGLYIYDTYGKKEKGEQDGFFGNSPEGQHRSDQLKSGLQASALAFSAVMALRYPRMCYALRRMKYRQAKAIEKHITAEVKWKTEIQKLQTTLQQLEVQNQQLGVQNQHFEVQNQHLRDTQKATIFSQEKTEHAIQKLSKEFENINVALAKIDPGIS